MKLGYYLSIAMRPIYSFCSKYRTGCDTSDGDSLGRDPCTQTRGWIDGERCAYFKKSEEERVLGRIFSRLGRSLEEIGGIKED